MKKRSRRKATLEPVVTASGTPTFLLDARRRLEFFNTGCERLTGWSADELLGRVCPYASGSDPADPETVTAALCPPAEVFEGHPVQVPVFLVDRNGHSHARMVAFFPLIGAENDVTSVLGLITEIDAPAQTQVVSAARRMHAELASLRQRLRQRYGLDSFVASSDVMLRACRQIELARRATTPLLITGPAGAGKEHVARLVHCDSLVRTRSFVPLDCARLSSFELKQTLKRLLDSEAGDTSVLPMTRPGTLYLANVESLPRDLQDRLVLVCSGRSVQKASEDAETAVRLMVASESDIDALSLDETIREDFFLLVTSLRIVLPPISGRLDEIAALAQHFLEETNRNRDASVDGFDDAVLEAFRRYNWPGNLTELATVVDEAYTSCESSERSVVTVDDLPFRFRTGVDAQTVGPIRRPPVQRLEPLLERVESEQITRALEACRFNKSKAAELLGITRPRLYRRMQSLGIADQEEPTP